MRKKLSQANSKNCNRESCKRVRDNSDDSPLEVTTNESGDVQRTLKRRRNNDNRRGTTIPIPSGQSLVHSTTHETRDIDARQPTWTAYFQTKPSQPTSRTPRHTVSYFNEGKWVNNPKRSDHGSVHKYSRIRRCFVQGGKVEIPIGEPNIVVQQPDNLELQKTRHCSYVDHRGRIHCLFRNGKGHKVATTIATRNNFPKGCTGCNVCRQQSSNQADQNTNIPPQEQAHRTQAPLYQGNGGSKPDYNEGDSRQGESSRPTNQIARDVNVDGMDEEDLFEKLMEEWFKEI